MLNLLHRLLPSRAATPDRARRDAHLPPDPQPDAPAPQLPAAVTNALALAEAAPNLVRSNAREWLKEAHRCVVHLAQASADVTRTKGELITDLALEKTPELAQELRDCKYIEDSTKDAGRFLREMINAVEAELRPH
jgi:hypothetical protein